MDTVLRGGKVYCEGNLWEVDLVVRDGTVASWSRRGDARGDREVDVEGKWVLPGFVDAHFHCRQPAHPDREDFTTGSRAAASGGITTYFEMPTSDPSVYNGRILQTRREMAEAVSVVDFALYAAPGTLDEEDLGSAVEAGAIAFKIFMTAGSPTPSEASRGVFITDEAELYRALQMVARTGLVVSVHAEDQVMLDIIAEEIGLDRQTDIRPVDHLEHRPPMVEDYASARLLALARHTGARVHLAHMSSGFSADLMAAARAAGADVSGETCHHYVAFEGDVLAEHGPFAKVNPPIRGGEERASLRRSIRSGALDILVSDHSPHAVADKNLGLEDIRRSPSGEPGVEMLGRYFLDQVLRGEFPMARVLDGLTINPATRFGVASRKGHLKPGADADMVIFDPEGEFTVDQDRLFTKSRASAGMWHGMQFRGNVDSTWVRGTEVVADGEIVGRAGYGRMVRPD